MAHWWELWPPEKVAAFLALICVSSALYADRKWKKAQRVVPLRWKEPAFWTAVSMLFLVATLAFIFFLG
jgi:hypothetical protein